MYRILFVALVAVLGTNSVQAAVLAPQRPSQTVRVSSSGAICGVGLAVDTMRVPGALDVPIAIPAGQVLVLTRVLISGGSVPNTKGTGRLAVQGGSFVAGIDLGSADMYGFIGGDDSFSPGVVIRSSEVPLCAVIDGGFGAGTVLRVEGWGYFAKDK